MAVVPAAGGSEPAGPVPAALPGANRPHPLAETGTQIRRIEPPPPFQFLYTVFEYSTSRRNLMAVLRIWDFLSRIRIFSIPDPYLRILVF
jgi:hypothetical protein